MSDTGRPTLRAARQRVREAVEDDGAGLHPQGPPWRRALRAAARRLLASTRPADRELGARGLALVAELAALYGAPASARASLREARRGAPHDFDLTVRLRVLASELRQAPPSGHVVDELLARDEPERALRAALPGRSCLAIQRRARALGAAGDVEGALAAWRALATSGHRVTLTPADWFYLPEPLFDDPRFWRVVRRLLSRLSPSSTFVHAAGVRDAVAPPGRRASPSSLRSTRLAVVRAQMARTAAAGLACAPPHHGARLETGGDQST